MPFTLPQSWSSLSWPQLTKCWSVKIRYGGNADVARVAALLKLLDMTLLQDGVISFNDSGERVFTLRSSGKQFYKVTARELAYYAKEAIPWFDYPYGDPGEPEQKDDKGNVIKERREAVPGYVSPMRDTMMLPEETVKLPSSKFRVKRHFQLPQPACGNMTWQQYRTLQMLVPSLFGEGNNEEQAQEVQAQFLAHCLVPRSFALLDMTGGSIRFRPHWEYCYNSEQADGMVKWWKKHLEPVVFHICFQCYQTAVQYYSRAYPLLFSGEGKKDTMRDALQGEAGTINSIMKYAGYSEQQQVYDSNIPFVLDILNTMAKEAKEIEKMNAKIKKK